MKAAADRIRLWREKPQAMVRDLFGITPDAWQDDVLAMFPHKPRIAMKACKGPGKTAVLSWLAWNFLLTRPHPKIAATSSSGDNLSDGLWTEMAMWQGDMRRVTGLDESIALQLEAVVDNLSVARRIRSIKRNLCSHWNEVQITTRLSIGRIVLGNSRCQIQLVVDQFRLGRIKHA